MDLWKKVLIVASILLTACGPKISPQTKTGGIASIQADQSMRQILNKKWSCSHSDNPSVDVLPYRKFTIFNDGDTQALQVAVYYADTKVPTVDLIQIDDLQCFYSAADVRIIKCASKKDRSLKVETKVVPQSNGLLDLLSIDIRGAESNMTIYFGGKENRLATLREFKAKYQDPFEILLTAPDVCGFTD